MGSKVSKARMGPIAHAGREGKRGLRAGCRSGEAPSPDPWARRTGSHACRPLGRFHIGLRVVDEDAVGRIEAIPIEQQIVDLGIRLQEPLVAGHDDAIEAFEERESAPGLDELRAGEIRDAVGRNAGLPQAIEQSHIVLDHAGDGLVPALDGRHGSEPRDRGSP